MSILFWVRKNSQIAVVIFLGLCVFAFLILRQLMNNDNIPARMSNNVVFQTYVNVDDQNDTGLETYDLNASKVISEFKSADSEFSPLYALYSPDRSMVLGAVDAKFGVAENTGDALNFSLVDFRPEESDYQVIPSWLSDSSGLLVAVTNQKGSTTTRSFYTYDLASRETKKLVTLSSPGFFANVLGNNNDRKEFYVSIMSAGQNGGIVETITAYSLADGSPRTLDLSDDLKEKREVVVRGDYVIYNKPNEQQVNILHAYNLATKEAEVIYTPDYVNSDFGGEKAGTFIGGSAPYYYDNKSDILYMSAVDSTTKGVMTTKIVKVDLTSNKATTLYEESQNTLYSILDIGGYDRDGRLLLYRRCLSECEQAPYNNQQLYSLKDDKLSEISVSRKTSQYFGFEVR